MANEAHVMRRAWQKRQRPANSQPRILNGNPRRELNRASLGECIPADDAIPHHSWKILARISNEIDGFGRITVNKDQASQRPLAPWHPARPHRRIEIV